MKSKNISERNGNGHHHAEALMENPTYGQNITPAEQGFTQQESFYPQLSETEVEDVEGVTMLRPGKEIRKLATAWKPNLPKEKTFLKKPALQLRYSKANQWMRLNMKLIPSEDKVEHRFG